MSERTFERLRGRLREGLRAPGGGPWLLYDRHELESLRARANAMPDLSRRIAEHARAILDAGDFSVQPEPYYNLGRLHSLVSEQMLRPSAEVADHVRRLLRAIGEAPTWVCHVGIVTPLLQAIYPL